MKRVLVTGASGFIGRHALAALLRRNYKVHAVSRRPHAAGSVHWHSADLLDPLASAALLQKIRPSHLLHLAWYAEPGKFWTSELNQRWVTGTVALVEGFRDVGGKFVAVAGSCAEYEWSDEPCDEDITPLKPATEYGICKNAARMQVEHICQGAGITSAWGRIFLLYGPHEYPSRFVASVIRAMLRDEDALCTHGNQKRDFLHVEDAADAFTALLDNGVSGPVNIGSGHTVSLAEIGRRIGALIGRPERLKLGARPIPFGDPPVLVPILRRLSQTTKWTPRYDLDAGLRDTIEWWRSALTTGDTES